jgi:hypothetical protein
VPWSASEPDIDTGYRMPNAYAADISLDADAQLLELVKEYLLNGTNRDIFRYK